MGLPSISPTVRRSIFTTSSVGTLQAYIARFEDDSLDRGVVAPRVTVQTTDESNVAARFPRPVLPTSAPEPTATATTMVGQDTDVSAALADLRDRLGPIVERYAAMYGALAFPSQRRQLTFSETLSLISVTTDEFGDITTGLTDAVNQFLVHRPRCTRYLDAGVEVQALSVEPELSQDAASGPQERPTCE
jgi:hypothetical protein